MPALWVRQTFYTIRQNTVIAIRTSPSYSLICLDTGVLLSELVLGLILVEQHSPQNLMLLPLECVGSILQGLDHFIRLLPEQVYVDKEFLLWPGLCGTLQFSFVQDSWGKHLLLGIFHFVVRAKSNGLNNSSHRPPLLAQSQNLTWIHRADFENHNKDGGLWLIINGRVYDIQDFK